MEDVLKQVAPPALIEQVEQVAPIPEPEPNGYGKDVGIVIVGIVVAASLYKLRLKYGKK